MFVGHISRSECINSKTFASEPSANNYILREATTTLLNNRYDSPVHIASDVPVTIQRYVGGATYMESGCEEHPLLDTEAIVLVTSEDF